MGSKRRGPKLPFGALAVAKGFCTRAEVDEALDIQRRQTALGRPKPLTGIVMVQNGFISTGELIDILRSYEDEPQDDGGWAA